MTTPNVAVSPVFPSPCPTTVPGPARRDPTADDRSAQRVSLAMLVEGWVSAEAAVVSAAAALQGSRQAGQ